MNALAKLWTVAEIELRQRLVSRTFIVIIIAFGGLLLILSGLIATGWLLVSGSDSDGGLIFASTLWLTVFLGTILVPVLSGGAVNGDRNAGTLATTQLTLVSTWQLLLGKVLAAWLSSLALLAVAVPFLVVGAAISRMPIGASPAAVGVLAIEFGVFSGLGVAWSSIVRSTVFSVVCTYLTIAMLSVGSLIGFFVGAQLVSTTVTVTMYTPVWNTSSSTYDECTVEFREETVPRWDVVYPLLAMNPYVIVVDALPVNYTEFGEPADVMATQKTAVRLAQVPPDPEPIRDFCRPPTGDLGESSQQRVAATFPTWPFGAALHVALVGLLLWWGWSLTRTPTRRLSPGSRVA